MQEIHASFGYNPRTAMILSQLIIVDQLLTGCLNGLSEHGRCAEQLLKVSESKTKGGAFVNTEQAVNIVEAFIDHRVGDKYRALLLAYGWTDFTRIVAALRSFNYAEDIRETLLRDPKNTAYIETTEEYIAGLLRATTISCVAVQAQPYSKPRAALTGGTGDDKRRLLTIHINHHQSIGVAIDPGEDSVSFKIVNQTIGLPNEKTSERQIYELLLIAMRASLFNGALFPYNNDIQEHLSSETVDSVTFGYDIIDCVTFMPCNL